MLTEAFVASISAHSQKPNTSITKDAGIFYHELQPLAGIRHLFKKSATPPNCLAVSPSHIFAAQEEKAVVHVYSREKGNQEALVPLQERIHAVALAANDSVLVLGTESGRLLLWEISTSRLVTAPASHLQTITSIAVESGSNFLLTGSADSSINVWSLPHLLSFSSSIESKSPVHTLSSHRGAITSLAISHSSSSQNIAVSTAADSTAIVWDYHTGLPLQTWLLGDIPRSICLDPADRAFYVGFDDGSVQLIDRYDGSQRHKANDILRSASETTASSVVEPPRVSRWKTNAENGLGTTLSLTLSWDSMTLLSGHACGKICTWDVPIGRWTTALTTLPGPVTNLKMLPPTGFPSSALPKTRIHNIVKPRPETPSSLNSSAPIPGSYTIATQFTSALSPPRTSLTSSPYSSLFSTALTHPSFPSAMLSEGIAELASWSSKPATTPANGALDSDFLSLSTDTATKVPLLTETERRQDAEERLGALQRTFKVLCAQNAELRKERELWRGTSTLGGKRNGEAAPAAAPKAQPAAKGASKKGAGKGTKPNEADAEESVDGSEESDDEGMDVDTTNSEASEIDIDEKLKYFASSDEESNSEGRRSGKAKRKKARRDKRKGKK